MNKLPLLTSAALALTLCAACSTQAWYESARRGAELECQRQPGSAAEECRARLNPQSYPDYEKARTGSR